jgi:hypothetical protein
MKKRRDNSMTLVCTRVPNPMVCHFKLSVPLAKEPGWLLINKRVSGRPTEAGRKVAHELAKTTGVTGATILNEGTLQVEVGPHCLFGPNNLLRREIVRILKQAYPAPDKVKVHYVVDNGTPAQTREG